MENVGQCESILVFMQNLRQKNPDSKPTTNEIIYNDDRVIVDDKTNSLI